MEGREWQWAKLIARHLAVVCQGIPAVEARVDEAMRVLMREHPEAPL